MTRQEAQDALKDYLESYAEDNLEKSKGAHMFECPYCYSGAGPNHTGAFSVHGDYWKCFCCGKSGDIFDLYGEIECCRNFASQLDELAELYKIPIEPLWGNTLTYKEDEVMSKDANVSNNESVDYTDFFIDAHKHVEDTVYWKTRGLSEATINRFQIGYIQEWKHPKIPDSPPSPRLIIPTSAHSYLAREVTCGIDGHLSKYSKMKVGSLHFLNLNAINSATKPIYIVEGEIDALSIIDVGGEAIALGTVAQVTKFLDYIKEHKPSQPLVIALDNDVAGEENAKKLKDGLDVMNVECYMYNPAGIYKDANEALQKDRAQFTKDIEYATHLPNQEQEQYLATSVKNILPHFINDIEKGNTSTYIPTGFSQLDNALDGGLYEGLYIIGAISSLGKTTIITQMADQMAKHGHDILIFSLEMSKYEIIAKSISRHTLQIIKETNGNMNHAKTARGITTTARYEKYNPLEIDVIHSATSEYEKYAEHLYIQEGVGDIGVKEIKAAVQKHIDITGNKPIVIIDYLQILAPYHEKATDKQNTDKAVLELKRIARDYRLPVIGISSFNRASYKEAVTMEAFKESGAIEYSSDVLIGLQLKGAGTPSFEATVAKKANPREIELIILKNRNGRVGDCVNYRFYSIFNLFQEVDILGSSH